MCTVVRDEKVSVIDMRAVIYPAFFKNEERLNTNNSLAIKKHLIN